MTRPISPSVPSPFALRLLSTHRRTDYYYCTNACSEARQGVRSSRHSARFGASPKVSRCAASSSLCHDNAVFRSTRVRSNSQIPWSNSMEADAGGSGDVETENDEGTDKRHHKRESSGNGKKSPKKPAKTPSDPSTWPMSKVPACVWVRPARRSVFQS